jgi:dephospho-CoA kinase
VLAERILDRLDGLDVVDSIRNPAEVQVLRRLPRFVLVGVHASVEDRFRRSRSRNRPGDPATLEGFEARERQENGKDPASQQLKATFALADIVIDNDGDLDQLHARIDRFLAERADPGLSGR